MAKRPARLLVAEPAPNRTVSESETVSRLSSSALQAVTPKAAKPEAEKPKPLPTLRLFSETTLKLPENPADFFSLLRTASTLILSRPFCFSPLIMITFSFRESDASTVVVVFKAWMQTEMLS